MEEGRRERDDLAHVFFVHSPITYSMAQATIRLRQIAAPILIGARGILGAGVACTVEDDGGWSVASVVEVLACVHRQLPAQAKVAFYLPHTAFLFGKLLKLSARVSQIYYLEEGYTSAYPPLINQNLAPIQVDLPDLLVQLRARGIDAAWQFDAASLHALNTQPDNAFDASCDKYAGAFACAVDAFAGMPNVTMLTLPVAVERQAAQLLSFAGIRNHFGDEPTVADVVEQCCRRAVVMARALRRSATVPVLVKLHPKDEQGLPDFFYAAFADMGPRYRDYCHAQGLDANQEPALLNFDHYHIVGQTAQAKYVRQFLGPERLTQYPPFF